MTPYSEDQLCLALILALDATSRGPPGLADCGGEAGPDSGPRDETLSSSDPSPGKIRVLTRNESSRGRGAFTGTLNEAVVLNVWHSVWYSEEA